MAGPAEPDYRLGADERLGVGVRRIVSEQIALAQSRLVAPTPAEFGEAVHEARKAFKRVRAVIRLVRDELGDEVYRFENRAFRDASRQLSDVRDSTVLVETLDLLAAREDEDVQGRPLTGLRAKLVEEQEAAHERVRGSDAVEQVLSAIEAARARLVTWPLPEDAGPEALAPGFRRVYRRGRRALQAARDEPTDESLHELRKRAKDLWHAAQIAHPAAPKQMKKLAGRAHDLSDLTGADHDLAVLLAVGRQRTGVMEQGEVRLLEALVARRRASLQAEAVECAAEVYARKPAEMAELVAG